MKIFSINFFQIFLIILLSWIGYSLHNISKANVSDVGRFELKRESALLFDTKTGDIYDIGSSTEPATLLFKGIE